MTVTRTAAATTVAPRAHASGPHSFGHAATRALLLAIWFGIATGLLEVLLFAAKKFLLHRVVRVSPHVVWMAPVADVVIFTVAVLVLILLGRLRPRLLGVGLVVGLLAFLSLLTLSLHYTPIHLVAKALLAAGLAVQAGRMAARHPHAVARTVNRTLGWTGLLFRRAHGTHAELAAPGRHVITGALLVIMLLAAGVQARVVLRERAALAALPAAAAEARNVILIIWDTVRAQSLSLYGYERPTTPRLQALAQQGVTFDHAFATAPWTLPTHASIFTGRWHHELSTDWETPLDATHQTLAEVLRVRGYRTAGFVANTFFGSFEHGLNRGFIRYEDYTTGPGQVLISSALGNALACGIRTAPGCKLRPLLGYYELPGRKPAPDVNRALLRWLDARGEGRPFFAFLNYFDAHAPYLPPEPYRSRFGGGPRGNPMHLEEADWKWTPEQAAAEQAAYDGAIAYLDDQLGRLLEQLQRRNLLEETVVIVTSDHGEEFLEHGVMSHSNSLYSPSLHVPLVLRAPHVPAGVRVDAAVSVRDIASTVLDLLGLDASVFPGASLAPHWRSGTASGSSEQYARLHGRSFRPAHYPVSRGDMESVIVDPFHYIRNGDGREELYDLRADPWELHDLAPVRADAVTDLRNRMERTVGTTTPKDIGG